MLSSLNPTQQRTVRWLRIGIACAVVLPTALFGAFAAHRYDQLIQEQQANTVRITRIVTEHALKLFDTNEILLQRLDELVNNESDQTIKAHEQELHRKVTAMVSALPQVQSVWITDASGHPVLTNRYFPAPYELDLSDRDSFRAHRAGDRNIYVTGALIGKKTKDVFFDLSRRREFADGRFAGTVQVSLYPKYLVGFYREVASNEADLAVTLMRSDGALIARWPSGPSASVQISPRSPLVQPISRGSSSGSLTMISTLDGTKRIVSYRKVGDYPVYATAGIRYKVIIGMWLREMAVLASFTFPIMAALVLVCFIALKKTQQELQLANQLYDESVHRQRVEEALLQSQKMEALGHLTGGVAHDFNNLLMVVDMNAHLLLQTMPQLQDHPRLEAIQRAVTGGTKLTRQLLSFSHKQPLLPTTVHLQDTFPGIVELCEPVLGRNIDVNLSIASDTPPVTVDTSELELAIINLAVNAKYAMPKRGCFYIAVYRVEHPASTEPGAEISVRDTGSGIAPEYLARVFEPFFTTREAGEGTGLGLAQVHAMCVRAGGSARIESGIGKGTTVYLHLPAARTDTTAANEASATASKHYGLQVLLVEDNDAIRDATSEALQSIGCKVHRCPDADNALNYIRQHHEQIDVVLSDIAMPGSMDGVELARHLRTFYPALPVALMTGYAQHLAHAEQLRIRVLPKPFGVPALKELLSQVTAKEAAKRTTAGSK
jgi:signal transduction histidine kinase